MDLLDLLNHFLNFVAPAFFVAVLVPLAARWCMKKTPAVISLWAQSAINFLVNVMVLALGLWFFGRDGKMATYSAMVLMCATSQWVMLRGWRA